MLQATDYEILRNVESNGRKKIPLERKPVRVATLINEEDFVAGNGIMIHNKNVFLEDWVHDWDWRDGFFTYYSRVDDVADVVVVYSIVA